MHYRNYLRAVIGHGSLLLPSATHSKPRIYINLRGINPIGGPDRFLRGFRKYLYNNGFHVSNTSIKDCEAALVFIASWGKTFVKLCRRLDVRTVLRLDGVYTSAEIEKYPPERARQLEYINKRHGEDLSIFDHVIYQSQYSKNQFDKHIYHRKNDFSIIHNGTDTDFFNPAQKKSENPPAIISVAKFQAEHIRLCFDVFERLRADRECTLKLVGPLSKEAETTFSECLRNSQYSDYVDYLGTVMYEDLSSILRSGDIFLHLKLGDSCPNAVIEALSCGLPIVCPAWGGTKELIGTGGIAVADRVQIINKVLVNDMVEAVNTILNDLPRYSDAARATAIARLDYRDVAQRYFQRMDINI